VRGVDDDSVGQLGEAAQAVELRPRQLVGVGDAEQVGATDPAHEQ
jgi:hypothetical protein